MHTASTDKYLQGISIGPGNYLAELEREYGVGVDPTEFAARSSITISASEARNISSRMGVSIPSNLSRSQQSEIIGSLPDLSDEQINQFVMEAQMAQMESEMTTMSELSTISEMEDLGE